MTYTDIASAVRGTGAALRSRTILQPVGGEGDKVFPVTYAGGSYSTEVRRERPGDHDSRRLECVLLDSVSSQANRAELALLGALRRGLLDLPIIEVDFSEVNAGLRVPIENLTSLEVPHRLADAILRDCKLPDGTRFSRSPYASEWGRSTAANATAVYRLCPTALLFGMWGSPEKPGGLGSKFERAFVSEIVGVDTEIVSEKLGYRIDPLGANRQALIVQDDDQVGFALALDGKAKGAKKPSEINHGNIPHSSKNAGVRFAYAEQTTVISLGALRKLRFPVNGVLEPQIDDAARTVLAILGIISGVLSAERELSLRSRCHLWPKEERRWELLDRPGVEPEKHVITSAIALEMLGEALECAERQGLVWNKEPIRLTPTGELVDLVRRSQELTASSGEEGQA